MTAIFPIDLNMLGTTVDVRGYTPIKYTYKLMGKIIIIIKLYTILIANITKYFSKQRCGKRPKLGRT